MRRGTVSREDPGGATSPSALSRAATTWWRRRNKDLVDHLPPDQEPPRLDLRLARLPGMVLDRLRAPRDRKALGGADTPWVTADAVRLMETLLLPTDRGLEYGSGGSTIWFARHSAEVRSVEASGEWFKLAQGRLQAAGIQNAQIHLADWSLGPNTSTHRDAYVLAHPDLAPGSLDWVFVDGEYRDLCTQRAVELLRPGGLLIIDNIDLYLPGPGTGPWTVDAPVTPLWTRLWDEDLSRWRRIWTTNGMWDTAFWFKPAAGA